MRGDNPFKRGDNCMITSHEQMIITSLECSTGVIMLVFDQGRWLFKRGDHSREVIFRSWEVIIALFITSWTNDYHFSWMFKRGNNALFWSWQVIIQERWPFKRGDIPSMRGDNCIITSHEWSLTMNFTRFYNEISFMQRDNSSSPFMSGDIPFMRGDNTIITPHERICSLYLSWTSTAVIIIQERWYSIQERW